MKKEIFKDNQVFKSFLKTNRTVEDRGQFAQLLWRSSLVIRHQDNDNKKFY